MRTVRQGYVRPKEVRRRRPATDDAVPGAVAREGKRVVQFLHQGAEKEVEAEAVLCAVLAAVPATMPVAP